MDKTFALKRPLVGVCFAVLSAAVICYLVYQTVNGSDKHVQAKTHMELTHPIDNSPLVIPAAAFYNWGPPGPPIPFGSFSPSEGFITTNEFDTAPCWVAPVYLPDGTKISSFTGYVYNKDQINDFNVALRRKAISNTTSAEVLSVANITDQELFVQVITGTAVLSSTATIDNDTYSYYVDTCLQKDHRLYAVEIAFKRNIFLPVAMKDFCHGFNGRMEEENNDGHEDANGPLCFGIEYMGNPDNHGMAEDSDYFFITVPKAGLVTISVTNFIVTGQVQLHSDPPGTKPLIYESEKNNPDGNYNIPYASSAGKYYIRIVSDEDHLMGKGNYTLTVTFD